MAVFKAYDIRGIFPDQLDSELAHRVGRAVARFLGSGPIAVGRDARTSSPELFDAIVRGVCDEGLDVVDLGLISTPMLYYAVDHLQSAGGIMITASHNPAQYNGFKVCRENAIPIGEASGLKEIEVIAGEVAEMAPVAERGSMRSVEIVDGYVEHVLGVGGGDPNLKIAIDCANGMASVGLEPLPELVDAHTGNGGQLGHGRLAFGLTLGLALTWGFIAGRVAAGTELDSSPSER